MVMGAPRIAFFFMWIFTSYVNLAFRTWNQPQWLWPLLGVVFVPWTSIAFVLTVNPATGALPWWGWIWVILGLFIDIGSWGGSGYSSRNGWNTGS